MNYCGACGDEIEWRVGGADECAECSAPAAADFNWCWSCGANFYEENPIKPKAKGFNLDWACDAECGGTVAYLMSYCPWCGEEQNWWPSDDEGALPECENCASTVASGWRYCCFCGESLGLAAEEEVGIVRRFLRFTTPSGYPSRKPFTYVTERLPDGKHIAYCKEDPIGRRAAFNRAYGLRKVK